MVTQTKPKKKTEVRKSDLDCGCFRYRTLKISRGGKSENVKLIDGRDALEFHQKKVEGAGTAYGNVVTGSAGAQSGNHFQNAGQVDYTFMNDDNANGCIII